MISTKMKFRVIGISVVRRFNVVARCFEIDMKQQLEAQFHINMEYRYFLIAVVLNKSPSSKMQ